jgi:hypothetical protein
MNDVARQRLRKLIVAHTVAACDDPRRFEALLKDYCPDYKRETNLLVSAVRERIPADLLSAGPTLSYALQRPRLVQRLIDHLGIAANFACWTVDTWAVAVGRISESELGQWEACPQVETQAPLTPPANAPRQSPLDELREAIRDALADGLVTKEEEQALKETSRRLNIPATVANRILAEVVAERKQQKS